MTKPQAPCFGCENSGTLHKRCEKYDQYKEDIREWKYACDLERRVDQYRYASIARRSEEYRKNLHVSKIRR